MHFETKQTHRRPEKFRITENPALFGLIVKEHGEEVEFVSYKEAALRQRNQFPAFGMPQIHA